MRSTVDIDIKLDGRIFIHPSYTLLTAIIKASGIRCICINYRHFREKFLTTKLSRGQRDQNCVNLRTL